jgi:hypothetical protein
MAEVAKEWLLVWFGCEQVEQGMKFNYEKWKILNIIRKVLQKNIEHTLFFNKYIVGTPKFRKLL